jgi:hypothetical protein
MPTVEFTQIVANDNKSSTDYVDDARLTALERALCRHYATPRVGHARRRCWPADELHAVLCAEP